MTKEKARDLTALFIKSDYKKIMKIIDHLETRLEKFESGSNKSLLNCHKQGKENFQKYIDTFYPELEAPGNFIRRMIDRHEPYDYDQIISGDF